MPQPLRTWLIKSYLTEVKNNSVVLFVNPDYYEILNNTYYLSQIYFLIKKVDSSILSLHLSAATVSDYAKKQLLELENVEMEIS